MCAIRRAALAGRGRTAGGSGRSARESPPERSEWGEHEAGSKSRHWVDVGRELRGVCMDVLGIELFVICGGLVIPTPVILNGGDFFRFGSVYT